MNVLFTCYCLNDPLDVIGATVPTELRERERERVAIHLYFRDNYIIYSFSHSIIYKPV